MLKVKKKHYNATLLCRYMDTTENKTSPVLVNSIQRTSFLDIY